MYVCWNSDHKKCNHLDIFKIRKNISTILVVDGYGLSAV